LQKYSRPEYFSGGRLPPLPALAPRRIRRQDAKKARLPSRAGYFSAIYDKENNSPQTDQCEWYKMESVSLGNGGKGNLAGWRGDSVGVVTRWTWPTNASFVEGVSHDQMKAIKNRLLIGAHRKDVQADEWAGYVVGDVLGLGGDKKTMKSGDKQRITKMLEIWIGDGVLQAYKAKVENRTTKDFIRTV